MSQMETVVAAGDPEQILKIALENRDRVFSGPEGSQKRSFCTMLVRRLEETNREITSRTATLSKFCREGCCHCCQHLFEITRAEATAISFYLLEHPDLLKMAIQRRIYIEGQFGHRGKIIAQYVNPGLDERLEYFKRKIPCDFLVDGRCMIYAVRPLICSSYIGLASGRVCSLEPKGWIPPEIKKTFMEASYWFQMQSKVQHSDRDELTLNWMQTVYEIVTRGEF